MNGCVYKIHKQHTQPFKIRNQIHASQQSVDKVNDVFIFMYWHNRKCIVHLSILLNWLFLYQATLFFFVTTQHIWAWYEIDIYDLFYVLYFFCNFLENEINKQKWK